jgi:predicted flap endonuclease-1-like 5' DNA nuclease
MAWSQEFPGAAVVGERAEQAWRVPMGVVSPLWAMFGAAAGAGIAYWWVTQWTRAVNIEALAAPTAKPVAAPQRIEIVAEPVLEAPQSVVAEPAPAPVAAEPAQAISVAAPPAPVVAEPAPVEAAAPAAPAVVAELPAETKAEAPVAKPKAAKAKPAPAQPPPPDDLTRMTGIGPKLSEALAAHGVTRFADIAAWTAKDIAEFDAALSLKGRAVREAWVAQAKRLAAAG